MSRPRKNLTREDIERAMRNTLSNRAAARYLGVSQIHYRNWAKFYKSHKEGYNNLYEEHLNPSGKGIPKFLPSKPYNDYCLSDIIEGRIDVSSFDADKLKYRLVTEGYLKDECYKCGFHERRVTDYKIPLILHFKDNNKKNYKIDNVEFLCYNCFFLSIGDIFTNKQIQGLENSVEINKNNEINWELDEYTLERLKTLGLVKDEPKDGSDLIHYA